MLETFSDEDDPINNLYARGGGLYKYDKLFGTKGVNYQRKHYCINFNSNREDKNGQDFAIEQQCYLVYMNILKGQ